MKVFLTKDKLPNDNEYVLAYFPNLPWGDRGTTQHKWVVAKFIQGLSIQDREKLPETNIRKIRYRLEDEWGNNEVPYAWKAFGPNSFFGQEVVCWCTLPTPLKETK